MAVEPNKSALRELLREDLATHGHRREDPGYRALRVHRLGTWRDGLPRGVRRKALAVPYEILRRRMRDRYRIELHHTASIGRRVRLSGLGGIIIGNESALGDDCVVAPDVTMAKTRIGQPGQPTIGDRVTIGPGAVFVGGVTIGDEAVIGPNVVVFADVPTRGVVLAPRPNLEPRRGSEMGTPPAIHDHVIMKDLDAPPSLVLGDRVAVTPTAPPRIDGRVEIADDCVFHERVFLGWDPPYDRRGPDVTTRVGSRVEFGAGAVLLRGVSVGDDVRVGANVVVEQDVPTGVTVTSRPARIFAGLRRSTEE